jgi:ADP-ribose pyrophosphatase YjhB (NUDIX family)
MSTSEPYPVPINRYDAAGGVVVRGEKVLVLIRRERNDIRLPKGHIEHGETPQEAALREVTEESGFSDLEICNDLGTQRVEFERNGKRTIRTEHYFLMMLCSEQNQNQPEPDRLPVWLDWGDALEQLTYDAEKEWIRKALLAVPKLLN